MGTHPTDAPEVCSLDAADDRPEQEQLKALVEQMMLEDESSWERRSYNRQPMFRPVTLTHLESGHHVSALTRDASPDGIGLLSLEPIELASYLLTVDRRQGKRVTILVNVEWSDHLGDRWYVSGGTMVRILPTPRRPRA